MTDKASELLKEAKKLSEEKDHIIDDMTDYVRKLESSLDTVVIGVADILRAPPAQDLAVKNGKANDIFWQIVQVIDPVGAKAIEDETKSIDNKFIIDSNDNDNN